MLKTLAAFFLVALHAATAQAQPGSYIHASELLGHTIRGAHGAALGEVAGLLLDVRKLGVHYALLAVPRPDGEEERFAYPVNALRREGDAVVLNVPAARLHTLPGYDGRRFPDGRAGDRYVEAQRLLGREMEDALGNPAATLRDVALDLDTGRTRYFLVEFEGQGALPLPPHAVWLHVDRPPTVDGKPARRG